MKRIGIEINGVLRDTVEKFKQIYEKNLLESNLEEQVVKTFELDYSGNTEEIILPEPFKYEIISDVTSIDLMSHFKFQNNEELYSSYIKE